MNDKIYLRILYSRDQNEKIKIKNVNEKIM